MRIGAFRIGALAERTGTSVATIRYYEEIGLLRQAARRGGQRIYDHEDARRLGFIRRCRDFDFSIPEIRSLLSLMQRRHLLHRGAQARGGRISSSLRRKLGELAGSGTDHRLAVSACAPHLRRRGGLGLRDPAGPIGCRPGTLTTVLLRSCDGLPHHLRR